jgi:protein subunit release factor A
MNPQVSKLLEMEDVNITKAEALIELTKRVNEFYRCGHNSIDIEHRRGQIGNGERSDKRRTYRVKDNSVSDHITNKTASLKDILRGKRIIIIIKFPNWGIFYLKKLEYLNK